MTAEELQIRRWCVCASGLIYWGGVLIQARRIRKRIRHSPNVKPRGSRERALWLGWMLVIVAWIGQPLLHGAAPANPALALPPALLGSATLLAGLALVILGYAGTLWTYAAMGDAWRIGIDPSEKTPLVSHGPFRWVRHPIYALQIMMLTGAGLLLPSPVSLAILVAHHTCVRLKARDEENYLSLLHGQAYRDYGSQTGRLFPRLRRRRLESRGISRPKVLSQ